MVSTPRERTRNNGRARAVRNQASRVSPESEKSTNNKNDDNNNADDGSVGSVQMIEPKRFPKAYEGKSTLGEYLQNLSQAQRNKVLHEIIESLEKDKNGSPKVELAQVLLARPVACLVTRTTLETFQTGTRSSVSNYWTRGQADCRSGAIAQEAPI